jgi:hypothetical protein
MGIELDILNGNYWEHFKKAKDLALIYPPEHEKRVELSIAMQDLLDKIKAGELLIKL